MSIGNTNPELTGEIVMIPQKRLSSLVLPDRAIPKSEVPSVAKELTERICEFTDSLTAYVMLKQAGEIIKSAIEQTSDLAMLKFSGKEMNVFGASVKTRSVTEYEYKDSLLIKMESDMEALKAQIDGRKKMLRSITSPVADMQTGEEIQPAKKVRDGITLTVSFK